MGAVLLGAGLIAAAYFLTIGKTAITAKDLIFTFVKAQIYKFASGGSMTIRLYVDAMNMHDTEVILSSAYLKAQLDGITVGIANLKDIKIKKDLNHLYFDCVMPWANLGVAAAAKVLKWFSSRELTPPEKITITGTLKAEGYLFNVNYTIPFTA